MELVYLGVGSNLGDREKHIDRAAAEFGSLMDDFRRSRLYETFPRYREDQPRFLNCVFSGLSLLSPSDLLHEIQRFEVRAGRNRELAGRMGPRPIDIDILLYGERIIVTQELTVPHPRLCERKFVLVPLLELDPLLRVPGSGDRYEEQLALLTPQGIYYHTVKSV